MLRISVALLFAVTIAMSLVGCFLGGVHGCAGGIVTIGFVGYPVAFFLVLPLLWSIRHRLLLLSLTVYCVIGFIIGSCTAAAIMYGLEYAKSQDHSGGWQPTSTHHDWLSMIALGAGVGVVAAISFQFVYARLANKS
jgi:hypothetical protein